MVDLCGRHLATERGGKSICRTQRRPRRRNHSEALRALERSGQLPASASLDERKAEQIVEHLNFFQAQDEHAQREQAVLEKEAEPSASTSEDKGLEISSRF